MNTFFVQQAWEAYHKGRLEDALNLFYKASEKLGMDNFMANIRILEKKMGLHGNIGFHLEKGRKIRVAAIMDAFTASCYAPECDLLQLQPNQWKEQMEIFHPDFVFIESAWKGIGGLWDFKISSPDTETSELFSWCRNKGIPSIFWNKEDPVHFQRFLHISKQADYVFTVDYDMIAAYKGYLGHDNVFLLPFAAQPSVHNPIEKYTRKDTFCFAGSWYPQYPKRQEDFTLLSNAAKRFRDIEIYDRNLGNERFAFPSSFQSAVKGTLPYTEIDKAYKGYRYGINVSTVKHSSTMFARRIYELLASNTVVLSNYARGVKILLGDLVLASDNENFLLSLLKQYTENEHDYRRFRLLGLRKVMREHTYSARLNYICSILGLQDYDEYEFFVVVLACVHNREEKERIISAFERQSWRSNSKLVLFQKFHEDTELHDRIAIYQNEADVWSDIQKEAPTSFLALLDPRDYYTEHYIEDMVLANRYSSAEVFGKASYYAVQASSVHLLHDGMQYRPTASLAASQSLVSRAVVTEEWLREVLINPRAATPQNARCLALDEFSYIQSGALICNESKALVQDIAVYNQGALLADIVRNACSVKAITAHGTKAFSLTGVELGALLPDIDDITKKVEGKKIFYSSQLGTQYKYIYSKKIFTSAELNLVTNHLLFIDGEGTLDIRFVIVFLDKNKNKISHLICGTTEKKVLTIPKECIFVKIGIRISGNGQFLINQVRTQSRTKSIPLIRNSCLVVAKHYPSYEDIYRYGFVHSRLRAYKESAINVDFFELSKRDEPAYREFEGIDVICGGATLLDALLASGQIATLCVHILERPLWEVAKKYLGRIKIIIWCHGAEIQLWQRRAFEFPCMDETSIAKAKVASATRLTLWQEVFQKKEYLQFVFVSQYLKNEVREDFALPDDSKCAVIHNFIDSRVFPYKEKSTDKRLKILSVSTYAALKYANDLTVKAISALQSKPYFHELQFSIYGDGKLFDNTISSLTRFNNVSIHRTFLRHEEIAQLHAKNGVILVPTRWDSQGVTRDEAMSSGLVPITNRIAAVPEFTDSDCALVVEPESADALADSIDMLYRNPNIYLEMSKKASERPRRQCTYENTIARELQLIFAPRDQKKAQALTDVQFIVYSDTNPNIFDGSSIWLTSVLSILARDYKVATLLKADIVAKKHVLQTVEHKEHIVFLEPQDLSLTGPLSPTIVAHALAGFEHMCPNIKGVVIRGYEIADILIQRGVYDNKLLPYLSAFYRPGDTDGFDIPKKVRPMVRRLLTSSRKALIQTPFLAEEYERFLGKSFCWSLLPPAIPDNLEASLCQIKQEDGIVHIGYGGKIYPKWGVEELILWTEELVKQGLKLCVHIAMSKIYNDMCFIQRMEKLLALPHVKVYKKLDRTETMSLMRSMDYAWCWREAHFERTTLEISMKLIENTALGLPCICYPSRVNIDFLGAEYFCFCNGKDDVFKLLHGELFNELKKSDTRKLKDCFIYSNITIDI